MQSGTLIRRATARAMVAAGCAALALGCTDVQQNFPEGGCQPGTYRCSAENAVERCTDDGVAWALYKQCAEGSACTTEAPFCEGAGTCTSDAECAGQLGDLGPCHEAACEGGQCRVAAAATGTECDDGNACTTADACQSGVCLGDLISCDDEDPCTTDACDVATGCTSVVAEGAACDDEQPCTVNDLCDAEGVCAGTAKLCEDANPCTDSACDQISGECVHTARSGECDDGSACTEDDLCVAGQCKGTPAFPCDVDGDCTGCGTDDPCGGETICIEGFCQVDPGTAFQCPQTGLAPCQSNVCVAVEGDPECQTVASENGTLCNDGSDCTAGDVCESGACLGTPDPSVPGCGVYRIGWYTLSAGFETMSNDEYRLEATTGGPAVFGTAIGDTYRIRAIGPGGGAQP